MKYTVLSALVLSLLLGVVFAAEVPLSDFGFTGITLTAPNAKDCQTVVLDLNAHNLIGAQPVIVSLKTAFSGAYYDDSKLQVTIDGNETITTWPEDLLCSGDACYSRLYFADLTQSTKTLAICLSTGAKVTSASVAAASPIGFYDTPVISIRSVSPGKLFLGDRAKMSIFVTNAGNRSADIYSQFVAQDVRAGVEITSFDIVEGESKASTTIAAGETKEFVFYIKPSQISSYNLPYAIVEFTDIFGTKERIASTHPKLIVVSPNHVDVSLISIPTTAKEFSFKVVAKNNWEDTISGILTVTSQDALPGAVNTITLAPNEEKEFVYTLDTLPVGTHVFSADFNDSNMSYNSTALTHEVKSNGLPLEILLAIVGVIGAVIIIYFVYYHHAKK